MVKIIFTACSIVLSMVAMAQRTKDTAQSRTVVVTSSFKPELKASSKINFSADTPLPETEKPVLQYDVPGQNLSFTYQSPGLKPLAANIDSSVVWANTNFIKAGYGNYTTPFLQAGVALGDGVNSVINVHGKYTSSRGSLPFQQFSKANLEAVGIFSSPDNRSEWTGKLYFDNNTQYQYGFRPDSLLFSKDELRRAFTAFGGKLGLKNKVINNFGINYSPDLSIEVFADNRSAKEYNALLNAPVSKTIAKIFELNVGFTADITSYRTDSLQIDNNLYYFTPSLLFKTPNFKLTGGFIPSWDNSVFTLLPNFSVEARINEEKFILQAGWVGFYNKTNYHSLANFNPWLQQPTFLLNTRIKEQYAGFKGASGSHFTYNAKAFYRVMNNKPLFLNDTLSGKSFQIVNEPELKAIGLHGEIAYTQQEKFSFMGAATWNQYSVLTVNEEAWGLTPLEITGTLKWMVLKDLLVKSDIFFWDGPRYRTKELFTGKLKPAVDVNAGLEFAVLPNLDLWLQFNNILNNKYERWNQYEVIGFNVLAGIVFSFDDIRKPIQF